MGIIGYIIAILTHNVSEYTGSYTPKKKYSDVKNYISGNNFVKSSTGRVRKNVELGNTWTYEYVAANDSWEYRFTIKHFGEFIESMVIYSRTEGAEYVQKDAMKLLDKKVPDCEVEPAKTEEIKVPTEDYSKKTDSELLDIFDKKVTEFGKNPCAETFAPVQAIRDELGSRIDAKPLSERGKYSKYISDMDMFIPSIKTQLNMPNGAMVVASSAGMYVGKIKEAISGLASVMQ